jgi:hypothetical protein
MRRGADISFSRVVDLPVAYAADEVIDSMTLGSAALRAMLRAAERAAGARLKGASGFAEERHQEALHFGLRAATENRRYAVAAPTLADMLSESGWPGGPPETAVPGTRGDASARPAVPSEVPHGAPNFVLQTALTPEALSILYAARVPASFVQTELTVEPQTAAIEDLPRDLRLSSRNARRYSNYLERTITRELHA